MQGIKQKVTLRCQLNKSITIAKFAMLLDFGAYTNYERTL